MFDCEFVTGFVTESFKVVGVFEWVFMMYFACSSRSLWFSVAVPVASCWFVAAATCGCGCFASSALWLEAVVVQFCMIEESQLLDKQGTEGQRSRGEQGQQMQQRDKQETRPAARTGSE